MQRWQSVWRIGLAPQLSTAALGLLRDALRADDPRLQQGATTMPQAIPGAEQLAIVSACAVGFCGWQTHEMETVGEVEEYVADACTEADRLLDEPGASRYFMNWFDDTPREEMRRALLDEVARAMAARRPDRPVNNHSCQAA